MRHITQHIIHCSDSPTGDVPTIREWHLKRGFDDIGYHFVILPSGQIELGRPLEKPGAHCQGHNSNSIGTCLIGRSVFTAAQFSALKQLHHTLRALFGDIAAHGHRDFTNQKTCPNFNVKDYLP